MQVVSEQTTHRTAETFSIDMRIVVNQYMASEMFKSFLDKEILRSRKNIGSLADGSNDLYLTMVFSIYTFFKSNYFRGYMPHTVLPDFLNVLSGFDSRFTENVTVSVILI